MSGRREQVMAALDVLLISARMQVSEMRAMPAVVTFAFVQPTAFLLVALLPLTDSSPEKVTRIVIGVLLTSFWTSTVWGTAGVLRRDRSGGTLARSLTCVRDPRLMVIGKGLGYSLATIVLAGVTVTLVLLVLRQPVVVAHPVWLLVGLVAVLLSGTAIGLLVGSIFVITRYGLQLSSALMYPMFLLGGMLIPLEMVPWGLRWISYGISLRWLQQFLAGAAAGRIDLVPLALAMGLTMGYGLLGSWLFQRTIRRTRKEATLELY
ncbi:ABC-2 type transport system permease protein [Nonomuraea thailandensis]|uniref:ABC-2 type transport system permease protein n=1 Tax=Nonomuraea thailandensis TaxID=1188745 RepID=A0A9X2G6P6_9ACTN|nr:ABC transporter permease [Nonomuraea thailandensis]MCP2353271.1 ABC-2 type transport system permease protein [Nonomuraea thailandensis]